MTHMPASGKILPQDTIENGSDMDFTVVLGMGMDLRLYSIRNDAGDDQRRRRPPDVPFLPSSALPW